jgi:hypothetical protein
MVNGTGVLVRLELYSLPMPTGAEKPAYESVGSSVTPHPSALPVASWRLPDA